MIACPRCGHANADDARYCSNCALELSTAVPAGEVRKTVTVMFMDAAGSTGIGERADPEQVRRVMTSYFEEIRVVVERHGGVVEKYIGDAVMAVFGVPTVHEDDALRAVRAASEIRNHLVGLSADLERERGLAIQWRTGINTGEVVAGDSGGGQRFVSGDAVNVAARLEQAAQPGEILLGAETYQLVRDVVLADRVEPIAAKGKTDPIEAHQLREVAAIGVTHQRRLDSEMVGRQRQRRLLTDAYEQSIESRACHLFTILGAAGVGKSRLVAEFLSSLDDVTVVLRGRCLSYGDGITYWPVAEAIRSAAGLDDADDDATVRAKIQDLVAAEEDRHAVAERLAAVIGRSAAAGVREETFWAVRTLLESIARRGPTVLVLDDIHWAEETLLDLIEHLAEWTRDAPLLLICLARPDLLDLRPGWAGGQRNATTLTLEPLNAAESDALMVNLLGSIALGGTVGAKIAAAADGNPLFIEEMIGMLVDNGDLVNDGSSWIASADLAAVTVPPTIQALLAARLDRLSRPERAVIERGSVEGQVFHRGAVAELAPEDVRETVADQLRTLSRKELVQPDRSDFAGDEAFRFRHLLIRDAAYSSMPKEARADLHQRFAEWLSRMAGDRIHEYEEILGYHYEQAFRYRSELGPIDERASAIGREAARHLTASARRALSRADIGAAIKLISTALELPADELSDRSLLVAEYGFALSIAGEPRRADEMLATEIARCAASGDELGRLRAEVSRLGSQTILGQLTITEVIVESERLLEIARSLDDEWSIQHATHELARHQFFAGHAHLAEELLTAQIARYPIGQAPPLDYQMQLATMYWGPRPIAEAVARAEQIRVEMDSRSSYAATSRAVGGMLAMAGATEAGLAQVREAAAIEEGLGRVYLAASSRGQVEGPMLTEAGRYEEAERVMIDAYELLESTGDRGFAPSVAGHLAALYVRTGRWDEAERFANVTLAGSAPDDVEAQSQGLQAVGRVRAARGDIEGGLEAAREAVAIADATDYLHRRGTTKADLAEVLIVAGQREEAIATLREAWGHFDAKGARIPAAAVERRLAEVEAEVAG